MESGKQIMLSSPEILVRLSGFKRMNRFEIGNIHHSFERPIHPELFARFHFIGKNPDVDQFENLLKVLVLGFSFPANQPKELISLILSGTIFSSGGVS